jgi:hypothetical protein
MFHIGITTTSSTSVKQRLFQAFKTGITKTVWPSEACRNGLCKTYICVPFVGDLDNNNKTDILKEVSHLHFTHLTELRVNHNHIYSVEGLARVQMAGIEKLGLSARIIIQATMIFDL